MIYTPDTLIITKLNKFIFLFFIIIHSFYFIIDL